VKAAFNFSRPGSLELGKRGQRPHKAAAQVGADRVPGALDRPAALRLRRYLWQVAAATFLVAVCPVLIVWWLRASGVLSSVLPGMLVAMCLSLGASRVGRAFWETRAGSGDLLFGELMAWGFARRWRNERRLASALKLLGSMNQAQRGVAGGLSAESQAKALERLSAALEARDPNTHGHSRRVARHAWMIARRMGVPREDVARIRTAAAVHDVGKIQTPTSILRKRASLTDEEFEVMKRHPVEGARMTEVLGDTELTSIVRHHHERLDGTGYPGRLSTPDIPLGARIIAVADTFDAITSPRPYRRPRPHHAAMDILKQEAGTQLDPAVVRAFCGLYCGRRSLLALWASVTSLPGQAFSSVGGGVANVATAAKVLAVAAVAGGAVASTPAVARPDRHSRRAPAAPALVATLARHAPGAGATATSLATSQTSRRGHRRLARAAVSGISPGRGAATRATPSTPGSSAGSIVSSTSPATASAAGSGATSPVKPSGGENGGGGKLPTPVKVPPPPVESPTPVKPPTPVPLPTPVKLPPAPVKVPTPVPLPTPVALPPPVKPPTPVTTPTPVPLPVPVKVLAPA
jgi:putative nucleotidyltransferase with HDIG domain